MADSEGPFALVAGSSLNQPLHLRAYGVFVQNFTAQWVQIAEVGFMPPNTSGSMALGGTTIATAQFAAPPAVAQPVAVAQQTCFLTYVETPLPFVAGPTQGSGLASLAQVERFAKANIPASSAANAGRLIMLTDYDRGLWKDTGTQFVSVEGEVFNVKQFGAKGDDLANDTTAINNAIAAVNAAANGGILFFPPGTYLFTTLTAFTKPVWVRGSGRTITTLHSTASVGVQIGDGSGTLWAHIKMSDLTIAPTGATPTKALYLAGGTGAASFLTRIVLENINVDMTGVTGTCDGIYLDGFILQPTLRGVYVYGGRDCISIQSTAIINMQMVRIVDCYVNNPTRNGLNFKLILQLSITDCEFDSNGSNTLNLLGISAFSIKGCILRHNVATPPVFLGSSAGVNCTGGVFEGCYFDEGIYKAISANGTANISIVGCLFVQQGTLGPFLSGDSGTNAGWTVQGCHGISTQLPMWSPPSMVNAPGATLAGQAANATVPAASTNYLGVGYTGLNAGGVLDFPMPSSGILQVLQVYLVSVQGAGGTLVFTLMKNGVATALTITVAAGGGGVIVVSDLVNQVRYLQGDLIELQAVNNAPAAVSSTIRGWSVQAINPSSLA